MISPAMIALAACAATAALEAVCAGRRVKARFAELRRPVFAPPLWVWGILGGLFYAVFFTVVYRLVALNGGDPLRDAALALTFAIMAANALWNYVFIRAKSLFWAFATFPPYTALVLALAACLLPLDVVAAWVLVPYLAYLVYANAWGYAVWRLNRARR
jgi:tryptophan-rich sensory protein